jgi:hypothetical protein
MKVLTKDEGAELLGAKSLDAFLSQLSNQLTHLDGPYLIPPDSGAKTGLSNLFAYLIFKKSRICIHITCWGVWNENLDLFYGYRRSFGEDRLLIEAPFHVFEPSDEASFLSIMCMIFYFMWDASIFDIDGKVLIATSHDEWLEVRSGDDERFREFNSELKKFGIRPLSGQQPD